MSGGRNIRFDMSWLRRRRRRGRGALSAPSRRHGDLIGFTSGTTGLPKPVFRPWRAVAAYRSPIIYGAEQGVDHSLASLAGLVSTGMRDAVRGKDRLFRAVRRRR